MISRRGILGSLFGIPFLGSSEPELPLKEGSDHRLHPDDIEAIADRVIEKLIPPPVCVEGSIQDILNKSYFLTTGISL